MISQKYTGKILRNRYVLAFESRKFIIFQEIVKITSIKVADFALVQG